MEKTLVFTMEQSAQTWPQNPLMWEKQGNSYIASSYQEIRELVHAFGAGLMQMGLKHGQRVALLSEGRNAWLVSELGVLYNGGINVPLSVKIEEPGELIFRIKHSGARFIIVSGNHYAKIEKILPDLPNVDKVIVLDDILHSDDTAKASLSPSVKEKIVLYQQVLQSGSTLLQQPENKNAFAQIYQSVKQNDPCNIVYTSGTTADPKGIILTHRNYTANVEQSCSMFKIKNWTEKKSLLILPWDHSFAHTAGVYTLLMNGASMASIQIGKTPMETLKNIPINIKEIKPNFLLSVPALAQNFRKNIEKGIAQKGAKIEKLFRFALRNAYAYNGNGWNKGKGLRFLRAPLHFLFDKILFAKVRQNFGSRLEFFVGGGALLDIELQRFFYALGIPMFQGYGLSEASPVISANVPFKHKLGSSGSILPDMELKILDDTGNAMPTGQKGQIVVKGENVMAGYWDNPQATRDTIRDEWLYTGDLGYMDEDGFLYVLGREKSLLISSDGEKYSPEGIEEALCAASPYMEQAMLHNNQSPYTVALIYPNKEALKRLVIEKNLDTTLDQDLARILEIFEHAIAEYKANGKYADTFPSKWLPAATGILAEGFTEQNKFLNSTLKMVRGKITEHYADLLDYLHTGEGKNIANKQNMAAIKKILAD